MRAFIFTLLFLFSSLKLYAKPLDLSNLPGDIKSSVIKIIPDAESANLTLNQLDSLIRQLLKTNLFSSVAVIINPKTQKYQIQYEIVKKISSIQYQGVEQLSESNLEQITNLKSGENFNADKAQEAAKKIVSYYRDEGFFSANVRFESQDESTTSIRLIYKIKEGPPTKVSSFKFISENNILAKKLETFFTKKLNQKLTHYFVEEMETMAKDYFGTEGYYKSELTNGQIKFNEANKASLSFEITNPDKYNFIFLGNTQLSTNYLTNKIELNSLHSPSANVANEVSNRIRQVYISRGYARVDVRFEEIPNSKPFQKNINIRINEGPRVKIDKINISGRISRPSDYYSDLLIEFSSDLIQSGYYHRADLEEAYGKLLVELQNQGYLRAKVISTRALYNKDRNKVTLNINIDEGPITQISRINFEGQEAVSEIKLREILNLKPGQALKLNDLEDGIKNLKNYYHELGYLEMRILNEADDLLTYSANNVQVDLNIKIFEGPQIKVASIITEGNSFTQNKVIMYELAFKVGDILTPTLLDESIRRLQRLGLFSSVDIRSLEEKTQIADRTIIVRVTERPPGLFNFGVGANNEAELTVRGYMGLAYRNIQGSARGISGRVETNYNIPIIKYLENKVTAGYLEPYLFESRTRGRINLIRQEDVTDYETKQVSETYQAGFLIERDLSPKLLMIYNVWQIATVKDFYIDPDPLDTTKVTNTQNIATTGPSFQLDYRDNLFNPSKGSFSTLGIDYSNPSIGSSPTIEFIKVTSSFTHYLPVYKKRGWVWANQLRGGYLENLSREPGGGVPYDKQGFVLGGRSTIRGYDRGERLPGVYDLGITTDNFNLTDRVHFYLFKSELRFPLNFIYENFAGAIFYDGGSVIIGGLENNATYDKSDKYRDSAGFALRYVTPFGPVSLDIGFKLDPQTDRKEKTWGIHFSFGTY